MGFQQGGTWDGDGFVATGKETPAIGTAFGYVEFFAGLEKLEYWQGVDMAVASIREPEARYWLPARFFLGLFTEGFAPGY